MNNSLYKFAMTVLCMVVTTGAVAAQQGASTSPGRQQGTSPVLAAPGLFTGMSSAPSVEIGKPLVFHLAGKEYCKLKLDGGDGHSIDVVGKLPFDVQFVYSGTTMSSNEVTKNYTASATPFGNCKTIGSGAFSVEVKVINPHPQGAAAAPKKDTVVVLAGNGKVMQPIKPASPGAPLGVPATITAIAIASHTLTGAPQNTGGMVAPGAMAAGSSTLLTVSGTGICKYHLSYVNLDSNGHQFVKQYPMLPKESSLQIPFPMDVVAMPTTAAGIYKWTATGVDGCTGSKDVTFAVQ
jgi:hypothetical protein